MLKEAFEVLYFCFNVLPEVCRYAVFPKSRQLPFNFKGFKLLALMHPWELEPCKLKEISLILELMMITIKIPGWPLERLRIKLSQSLLLSLIHI